MFDRSTDVAGEKKRSKITGDDVFTALRELGFDKYEEELREFMKNYNADKEDAVMRSKMKKRAFADQ